MRRIDAIGNIGTVGIPCDGRALCPWRHWKLFVIFGYSYGRASWRRFRVPDLR